VTQLVIFDYNDDVSDDHTRKPGTLGVDPVGMVEIGERLGARRQTVAQWHFRRLLPAPRWTVSGYPAWNWPDIERWARDTGRLPERKGSRATSGVGGRRGGKRR
jgi:hypothetical protein